MLCDLHLSIITAFYLAFIKHKAHMCHWWSKLYVSTFATQINRKVSFKGIQLSFGEPFI